MNVCTKGFCSAPARSCDIRDKVRNGILDSLKRIKLHIEIVNLKPVTPTTILLRGES